MHKRLEARVSPRGHDLEALGRQSAIEADQLSDITDCPHRREVQPGADIGFSSVAEQAPSPGLAVQGCQQHEHHARRRQMPLPRATIRAVGIDQRGDGRDLAGPHQMVINHHDRQFDFRSKLECIVGSGTAIDRDHQIGTFVLQASESCR